MTDFAPSMPEGDGLVPGWLERLAAVGWRLLATIALGLVLLWIAILLATVTASILVAAIVAATFAPFVLALRDRGWSRIKAAAAVFVGAMLVILATLAIIALAFLPAIKSAVEGITDRGQRDSRTSWPASTSRPRWATRSTTRRRASRRGSRPRPPRSREHRDGGDRRAAGDLPDLLLPDGWRQGLGLGDGVCQPVAARDASSTAGHVALERVGGYLRGTAVIAAFDGLVEGLFLVILGVPDAGALAVVVFLGRFIPYIGGLVTTIVLSVRDAASAGSDGGPRPAGPDHDPQRHPGQVPGAGHLSPDGSYPPGDRAHRAAGRGGPGGDHRSLRRDPGRRLRARHRRRAGVDPRRRRTCAGLEPTRWCRSGSTGSANGAGGFSARSACSRCSSR